ncbi:phage tail protein [Pseudomonas sp.]|uniref:phage tail protein n=1 Tax=Pseudomonas sp. TaxID=306 RepID=UPI003263AEF7
MIDATSQFFAILTNVGMAKQANADALGIPWKLTEMGVGDANDTDPIPSATQTQLIREWRRRPLNQLKIDPANPTVIIAEQVIPADEGGFWIREIGLYDADGDLVAVANCAPSFKPVLSQGSGRTQVVRMNFVVSNAGNITLKIDPAVVLATREYADTRVQDELYKLDSKQSVRVAATANIALSGLQTVDGVALVAGDRVLVPAQTAAKDNGVYVVASGPWVRGADSNTSAKVTPGLTVTVEEGTANGDSLWHLVTNGPVNLGTTALLFEMLAGRTGVEPGTYKNLSVDKYGRVLGGTNPTTLSGFGIGDAYTKPQTESLVSAAIAVPVVSVSASKGLVAAELGLVLIDSAAAAVTVTLPASDVALGVREVVLRRTDTTANALVIATVGTDKILLDTTAQASGQTSTELLFAGDYLRLRSDGAGKWWCVGQAQLPGSIATGLVVFTAAGITAFSIPAVLRAGRRVPVVRVTGGGGGGACKIAAPGPSGGGGGGVAEKRINLTGVTTVSVTVGSGGAGGQADGAVGQAGGASSFGAYCSGSGGGGGFVNGNGAGGGSGVNGDINYSIGGGCPAVTGAGGGTLYGGSGGGGVSIIAAGDSGTAGRHGCGGGGRTATNGAPGAGGLVEVWW